MDLDEETMAKYYKLTPYLKERFDTRYEAEKKQPGVFYLLLVFLGGLGLHRFYVRSNDVGIAYLVLLFLCVFGRIMFIICAIIRFGLFIYDLCTGVSQTKRCNELWFRSVMKDFDTLMIGQRINENSNP